MNPIQNGSLYAILSGFLYGFIGYFGMSAIHDNLSISTMLFWRFFIASIVMLLIILPDVKQINCSFKEFKSAFINGALYYALSTLLYFWASHYIGSGMAMVIFFTYPVLIMLINYFVYGQKIVPVYYLAAAIIFIGMICLVDVNQLAFDLSGIAIGLVSAFFYACYMISSKRTTVSPNLSTLVICFGCMFTCLTVALYDNTFTLPLSIHLWTNLLGISIVSTVVPILLMLYSLKSISSERASILSVLEPVFVVIFGALLLGEHLDVVNGAGVCLILIGAMLTLFSHKISQYLLAR